MLTANGQVTRKTMNRFPFTYFDPNFVSPARKEEMEAEREREADDRSWQDPTDGVDDPPGTGFRDET